MMAFSQYAMHVVMSFMIVSVMFFMIPRSLVSARRIQEIFDTKNNIVDNLRTVAAVDYRLTRRQYLSAFVRMDNDLQVKEPVDRFYLGVTYKLKY